MKKAMHFLSIGLLIGSLVLFIVSGFLKFATENATAEDDIYLATSRATEYAEMLFVQLGTLSLLSFSTVFTMSATIICLGVISIAFLRSKKTKKWGVILSIIYTIFLLYGFLMMMAAFDWFSSEQGTIEGIADYKMSAGGALMLVSLILGFLSLAAIAVDRILAALPHSSGADASLAALVQWKNLLDSGIISEEEFANKKAEIFLGKSISKVDKAKRGLDTLKNLRDNGAITEEEFEAKKSEII